MTILSGQGLSSSQALMSIASTSGQTSRGQWARI
jgi:hypothetical protein